MHCFLINSRTAFLWDLQETKLAQHWKADISQVGTHKSVLPLTYVLCSKSLWFPGFLTQRQHPLWGNQTVECCNTINHIRVRIGRQDVPTLLLGRVWPCGHKLCFTSRSESLLDWSLSLATVFSIWCFWEAKTLNEILMHHCAWSNFIGDIVSGFNNSNKVINKLVVKTCK